MEHIVKMDSEQKRAPYQKPELKEFGSVIAMTKSVASVANMDSSPGAPTKISL
jgi:hypothetical protein